MQSTTFVSRSAEAELTGTPQPAPARPALDEPVREGAVPEGGRLGRELAPGVFDGAVAAHLADMLRAAESILGSEDLAWDAVQETLLRLWVRGWLPEQPGPALVHLTVRSSLHQLRCLRRRGDHESHAAEECGPCCEEDPMLAVENAELAAVVREEIRGLTEEYRAVLELFELEGLTYQSIAGRLDLPIGTVRSRLSRGRALLRDRLVAHGGAAERHDA